MLNYLPCLLETMLLLITILTITLNAVTQLLLEGEITRPLFGHARTLAPKWDEDFAIALLRLGTASLEATNVAGLGNEVGSIAVGDSQLVDTQVKKVSAGAESTVEMNSAGFVSISFPHTKRGGIHANTGFTNEIKNVKAKNAEDDWLIDYVWLRELTRFSLGLLAIIRGVYRFFLWLIWYRWKGIPLRGRSVDVRLSNGLSVVQPAVADPRDESAHDSVYRRFLRGEDVTDDEFEYVPSHEQAFVEDSDSEEIEPDAETDDSDGVNGMEATGLYLDLLSNTATSSSVSPGPVLIAHMTAEKAYPLTRRRYNELVPQSQISQAHSMDRRRDDMEDFIYDRRGRAIASNTELSSAGDLTQEGRMNCVICTSEPREIICWPCKCLALCNDCRENLASRVSASKHTCPCCRRRSVERDIVLVVQAN